MPESAPSTSYSDVTACDWKECIASSVKKSCSNYHTIFSGKLGESQKAGDEPRVRGWQLLTKLTSPYPRYDDPESPYGPMMVLADGRRTALPEDLSDEEVDILRRLLPEVEDEEFKARINDFLWLIKKDYRAAMQAGASFIKSSKVLRADDFESWPEWIERLERAGQLSKKVNNVKLVGEVVAELESLISSNEDTANDFLLYQLMELLLQMDEGDPKRYAPLCEKVAGRVGALGDWYTAERYLGLQALWLSKDGDANAAQSARIRAAEATVEQAEALLSGPKPSYFGASGMLAKAIEALRQARGPTERLEELRERLREYQQKSTSEFDVFAPPPLDITAVQMRHANSVKGRALRDAILYLAFADPLRAPDKLRQRVEQLEKNYPFSYLFNAEIINDEGKVVARTPGLLHSEGEEREEAFLGDMIRQADLEYRFRYQTFLSPVLTQIRSEHPIRKRDIVFLCEHNPFVPPGQEEIFARGILAGFQEDWLQAGQYLLPQIENSLRAVLQETGAQVTSMSSDLIQKEMDINRLLDFPEAEGVFGKTMLFHLRALLIAHAGSNLRNLHAHGLLKQQNYYSAQMATVWSIVLRLCCSPFHTEAMDRLLPHDHPNGKGGDKANGSASHPQPGFDDLAGCLKSEVPFTSIAEENRAVDEVRAEIASRRDGRSQERES